MMKTLIAFLLSVLAVCGGTPVPVVHADRAPLSARGVHVIGDSITYHSLVKDRSILTRTERSWTTDGSPGRVVDSLGRRYIAPTTDYGPRTRHIFTPPRARIATAVLALGTNTGAEVLSGAEARALYAAGVRRIRKVNIWKAGPKRIVLVTPWKSPSIKDGAINPATGEEYPPFRWYDRTVPLRRAIYHVARHTGYVCVMDWAAYAERHPGRFPDGVHPDAIGREVWRRMMKRTIDNCGR